MLITSREQKLIHEFLKSGTLTISEMLELTGTSRRTLYRDLDKLQQSLPQGVSLRTSGDGYLLTGNLKLLTEARELVEYSSVERLHGELMLLIEDRASIASITESFGVSQPTATSDLRQIEQTLLENELMLEREQGLSIKGREENIRSVLVASIYNSCSIHDAISGNFAENKVLAFLDLEKFSQAQTAFEAMDLQESMTDKVRVLMQFFLTAVLLRLDKQRFVDTSSVRRPSKRSLNFVNQLLTKLSVNNFTIAEITYLAAVYDVLYFGFGREILFMEKFDTDFSYKIRQLIEQVSQQLEIEFSKDDRLYGLLYAHLKESDVLPTLFSEKQNDFVKKIESDNEKIFQVVQTALTQVFAKRFSEMEFAFVTLHFVATLERSDLVLPLRAALVSSRGRISCEFLMSSLRKNFPFLKKIDLIQSSTKFDKNLYDVIFTTEKELDYIYVSRTLEQKNLDDIRHKLRTIQQGSRAVSTDENQKNFINLNQMFSTGQAILTDFKVTHITNLSVLTDVVNKVVSTVNEDNQKELAKLLEKRFEETHLAIPDTKMALLHGVHPSVAAPLFRIFDLSQEVEVIAMNRKPLKIKRILLLLAPPEVPDYVAYLLGKISSSIIENKLYTTIYDSGNYAIVSELLRQIITESIRKYGE
ncbi:MAG: transcription antiterminator [Streptococcaceae bacterium]|nr:transcription antiterminator [Streptococcaceae bacterium]